MGRNAIPEVVQPLDPAFRRIAGDQRRIDGADRHAGDPVRREPFLGEAIVDASLIGAQGAAALQHQDAAVVLVEGRRRGRRRLGSSLAGGGHLNHLFPAAASFGVLLGHHVGAGDNCGDVGDLQGPVRVSRQVLDRLELACRFLKVLERPTLRVDRVDDALFQRGLQRTEGQVMLVVALEPKLGRVLHRRPHHGRIVVPVVRVWELDDLHVLAGHAVHTEHQLDALLLLDAPPVVLDRVEALGEADLLSLQLDHSIDVVPRAHHHAAAFARRVGQPEESCPANVRVDVDRWEQSAEADEVVEIVDVVRVPVVVGRGAHEGVLHADLLVLLAGPTEFLVDIAGGNQRAIRVPHLFPVERNGAEFLRRHVGFPLIDRVERRRLTNRYIASASASNSPLWASESMPPETSLALNPFCRRIRVAE